MNGGISYGGIISDQMAMEAVQSRIIHRTYSNNLEIQHVNLHILALII